jgi:hypothetical protein
VTQRNFDFINFISFFTADNRFFTSDEVHGDNILLNNPHPSTCIVSKKEEHEAFGTSLFSIRVDDVSVDGFHNNNDILLCHCLFVNVANDIYHE